MGGWNRRRDVEYYVNHRGDADMTSADQTQAPPDDFPDDPLAWKKLGGSEYVRYVYDGVTSVETDPWRYDYEQPPDIRTTCIDAVLVHHVLPLCDIDTDSNNNGSITDEDDPVENADAGPGRIVPVGSSQLTEVHLSAAPVDAVLAMPQDWRACLWSPSGGGHIRIWDTPDKQHELHFPTAGADWWNDEMTPTDTCWAITTANPLDMTVWVEGISTGTTQLELAVASFDPGAQPNAQPRKYGMVGWFDRTKYEILGRPDMDVYMIDHNIESEFLPDSQEDSPGAWVPLNNDDDAYDHYDGISNDDLNFNDAENLPRPIPGEDDLLPIVLRHIDRADGGGWYILNVPQGLDVWRSRDRSGLLTDGTSLRATDPDTTLYVEGVAPGPHVLSVDWMIKVPNGPCWVIGQVDTLTVNVFEWLGPLNVPDYSKHHYQAVGVRTGLGQSMWLAPDGGVIDTQYEDYVDEHGTVADLMEIKWESPYAQKGEAGKAIYQASPDFIWDLKVNVVQVIIGPPDCEPAFVTKPPVDQPPKWVEYPGHSGLAYPAKPLGTFPETIESKAKVTLNGPDGGRGVRFMRVGFVQDVEVTEWSAEYGGGAFWMVSSLQGQSFCDSGAPTGPYASQLPPSVFFDPDPTRNVKVIEDKDTPTPFVLLQREKNNVVGNVSYVHLKWDFDLYVTVRTADSSNEADKVYTCRAKAHWHLWCCGTIGAGTVLPWPNVSTGFAWTGTPGSFGTLEPEGWLPVTDGTQPPELLPDPNDPNKKNFDDELETQTFN